MPVVSTMGLGIDRSGRVERYQPPKVIEEGGGGGGPPPGPGPLLQSAVGAASVTTPAYAVLRTLSLGAGSYDIWAQFNVPSLAPGDGVRLAVSLDGTTAAGVNAGVDNNALNTAAGSASGICTWPFEVTLAAAQDVYLIGRLVSGTTVNLTNTGLFARQLA